MHWRSLLPCFLKVFLQFPFLLSDMDILIQIMDIFQHFFILTGYTSIINERNNGGL